MVHGTTAGVIAEIKHSLYLPLHKRVLLGVSTVDKVCGACQRNRIHDTVYKKSTIDFLPQRWQSVEMQREVSEEISIIQ